MFSKFDLKGVIPPVVTPLTEDGRPHLNNLQRHIRTMSQDGCNGVLLMGTTGEGPSMGLDERQTIIDVGVEAAKNSLAVIAHTGCASLRDTITLTRYAYESGVDATIVVPPFYYKGVPLEGLLAYYRRLLDDSVPESGKLLLYHIPQVAHVAISFDLLEGLLTVAPDRVVGVKDSSGDPNHLRELCLRFPQLRIFAGNDRLLLEGLHLGTAGCITAAVNVLAPLNVSVYRAFQSGEKVEVEHLQERLTAARAVLEEYMPFPPTIKYLLSKRYGTSGWEPRPPLIPLAERERTALVHDLGQVGVEEWVDWL